MSVAQVLPCHRKHWSELLGLQTADNWILCSSCQPSFNFFILMQLWTTLGGLSGNLCPTARAQGLLVQPMGKERIVVISLAKENPPKFWLFTVGCSF